MPIPYQLALTDEQRGELVATLDHAALPYLRERAAALLKIADGQSIRTVAATGCLKPRDRDTLCAWAHRYQQQGLTGLLIRKGRGRKPACFPTAG
jgi:hypothetical protein